MMEEDGKLAACPTAELNRGCLKRSLTEPPSTGTMIQRLRDAVARDSSVGSSPGIILIAGTVIPARAKRVQRRERPYPRMSGGPDRGFRRISGPLSGPHV